VKLTLALLLVMLLSNLALADIFRLRDGTTVTGTIESGGIGHVILEPFNGVVIFAAVTRENPAPTANPVHIRKLPQTPEEMDALMRDCKGLACSSTMPVWL
jgi:hypothetical protein